MQDTLRPGSPFITGFIIILSGASLNKKVFPQDGNNVISVGLLSIAVGGVAYLAVRFWYVTIVIIGVGIYSLARRRGDGG